MVYSSSQHLHPLESHIKKMCEIAFPETVMMTKQEIARKYKTTAKRWRTMFKRIIHGLSHKISSNGLICPSPKKRGETQKKQKRPV